MLAVDPSSVRTGGSVLGDKTRMARLAADPHAFIRPSPSAGTLGGVARATTQAMLVLEAAGYDVVLVETVGVGQSEVTVAGMVDTFCFLTLARTGDQLQGIKKGILEIADVIAVNKADGDREIEAKAAARELSGALRMVYRGSERWVPPVLTCSALHETGVDEVWAQVLGHRDHLGDRRAGRTSGPPSSWTSCGRWSATSSTSGCGGRRASRPSATRSAPRSCPASCRRRWPPTASWRRTTGADVTGAGCRDSQSGQPVRMTSRSAAKAAVAGLESSGGRRPALA